MNRKSGDILILLVSAVLLVYTAYRSLHVVQTTLPPDAQILGYVALFGLDFALVAWTVFKAKSARGDMQHAIAIFMILLQWVGVTALTLGDTLLTADPVNAPSYIKMIALWAAPIIISVNVGAAILVHLSDPQAAIHNARRDVQDEIERQVSETLKQNAGQIASQIAPTAAAQRAAELLAEFELRGGQAQAVGNWTFPWPKNGSKAKTVTTEAGGKG